MANLHKVTAMAKPDKILKLDGISAESVEAHWALYEAYCNKYTRSRNASRRRTRAPQTRSTRTTGRCARTSRSRSAASRTTSCTSTTSVPRAAPPATRSGG